MEPVMLHVRKALAGSDSFGHVWPEPGSVVEMPGWQARELLAIKDGGFTLVEDEPKPAGPAKVTEPAPEPENAVTEPGPGTQPEPEPAARAARSTATGRGRSRAKVTE